MNAARSIRGNAFSVGYMAVELREPIWVRFSEWWRHLNKTRPFATAFFLYSGKAVLTDIFAQKVIERKRNLDRPRTAAMACFGGAYAGCFQHYVFNIAFTRLFGASQTINVALKKVLADACVHTPFLYLPCYLALDEAMSVGSIDGLWNRWCDVILPSMKSYAMVWPMVYVCVFSIVPTELRMTTVALASLVWLVMMSCATHSRH